MLNDLKHQLRTGNIITKLLIINIGIFAVQSIVYLIFSLSGKGVYFENFLTWFYFPEQLYRAGSSNDFMSKPWTIFTYQFLHHPLSIFHILFNMLYLYFFGRILVDFLNHKYVLPLYLTGGIAGAVLFMITYNISPMFQTDDAVLVGASASILALVVAAATLVPDYTVYLIFFGPVRLKYIALIAVLVDVVSISGGSNPGGHIAHIGGALIGFFYVKSYRSGSNWFSWFPDFTRQTTNVFRRRPKVVYVNREKTSPSKKSNHRPQPTSPGVKHAPDKQKRMDEILDKIAQSGYDSLSKAEKEFLFKISNEKE
jgi:membrane associated rhomboid family serine protease